MSGHETALQIALLARLRADVGLQALIGTPARVWDEPPEDPGYPYLLIGRGESRPVEADGCGVEHRLTLIAVSEFRGHEEARAIVAAVRACLEGAELEHAGVRTISLSVGLADVFRAGDHRRIHGVMRLRAVTEGG